MSKKLIVAIVWIASLVLAAVGTYYGSAYWQQYSRVRQIAERTGMSIDQVQSQFAQSDSNGQNGRGFGWNGGSASGGGVATGGQRTVIGKVDSVEDGVVTITTARGSEKITLTDKAAVSKAAPSNINEIKPGQQIWADGTRNSDGNFEATTIVQVK